MTTFAFDPAGNTRSTNAGGLTLRGLPFRLGDVISYDSARPNHCREGMAVVVQMPYADHPIAVDTYWSIPSNSVSDSHILTFDELATASVLFNLGDVEPYDVVRSSVPFEHYAESDRFVLTSQHGCRKVLYLRRGAQPDQLTMLRDRLETSLATEDALDRARRTAQYEREQFERALRDAEFSAPEVVGECVSSDDDRICTTHGYPMIDGGTTCERYERIRDHLAAPVTV